MNEWMDEWMIALIVNSNVAVQRLGSEPHSISHAISSCHLTWLLYLHGWWWMFT